MYMYQKKLLKWRILSFSFLTKFRQRPCTGSLARFLSNFKKSVKNQILIGISSNFLHNIRTCICIRKNYKNGKFSPFHFWRNLAKDPVL